MLSLKGCILEEIFSFSPFSSKSKTGWRRAGSSDPYVGSIYPRAARNGNTGFYIHNFKNTRRCQQTSRVLLSTLSQGFSTGRIGYPRRFWQWNKCGGDFTAPPQKWRREEDQCFGSFKTPTKILRFFAYSLLKVHLHHSFKMKSYKEITKEQTSMFFTSYYFCLMMEGSGSVTLD